MNARTALLIATGLLAGNAYADCAAPASDVAVPSGATASRDDMVAAQKAVKAYDTAVREYSDCMSKSGLGSEAKVNEQIDRLKKVADKFNTELKIFKDKNAS
ncbi:MAG: hypothetical protein QM718_15560 [Steroidobacteraceae bacterium]